MKIILLTYFLSITSFASSLFALNENAVVEIYTQLVATHIKLRERLDASNNVKSEKALNISKERYISEAFPKSINGYKINYLSDADLKKQPSSFNIVMLSPIQLMNDTIVIRAGDYAAEREQNGELFFSYSVGTECGFKYDKK